MLTLASWELKNEWISNGRDRGLLPGRNRVKERLCIYDEAGESIEGDDRSPTRIIDG